MTDSTVPSPIEFNKIKLKKSSVPAKVPTLDDLSFGELALNFASGRLYYRTANNHISSFVDTSHTREPTGFPSRFESVINFDNLTRTFSLKPIDHCFNVWVSGNRWVLDRPYTIIIPDVPGLYYIYFNKSGQLVYSKTAPDYDETAMVAYVYWNSSFKTSIVIDERHGTSMDWATHEYFHTTQGAVHGYGFDLISYPVSSTGESDADAQFSINDGIFFDEDLKFTVSHNNTPALNSFEQTLSTVAKLPILYLDGTEWLVDSPSVFAIKSGFRRPQYNYYNGSSWSAVDVMSDGWYTTTWVVATGIPSYPVVAIMGQSAGADVYYQEDLKFSNLIIPDLPVKEFRPLYKIIWQVSNQYTNNIRARIVNISDLRSISHSDLNRVDPNPVVNFVNPRPVNADLFNHFGISHFYTIDNKPVVAKRYEFTDSLEWVVRHDQNTDQFFETITDDRGNRFNAGITIIDQNSFKVKLTTAMSGKVDVIFVKT